MKTIIVALVVAGACLAAGRKQIGVSSLDEVIPQWVYGGGWKTSATFVNMDEAVVTFKVSFFTDAGEPWRVPFEGVGTFDALQVTIPPNGTLTIQTSEGDQTTLQGWARLDLPCCPDVGGFGVFRHRITGRPDFEAVIPISSSFETRSFLVFDNSAGYSTGVSLVNPSSFSSATLTLNFRDEAGSRILLDQITLRPLAKQVFSMPERFSATAGKRGTLEITSSPGQFAVLGLRFNPGGAFTSMHGLDP